MNESDQNGGLHAILSAFVHEGAVVSLAFAGTAKGVGAKAAIYRPNKEATNMKWIIHLITIILLVGCAAADARYTFSTDVAARVRAQTRRWRDESICCDVGGGCGGGVRGWCCVLG